jgi:hypothetical protein
MTAIHSWCILILIIIFLPSFAFALAGFAERTSVFHFNDYTFVERGHPSDTCSGPTNWCLKLSREGYRDFKDIESTFSEINVPPDNKTPLIIGRLSSNDDWLVYDLQEEKILISHPDYKQAIEIWYSLGMEQPTYVNSLNTRDLLTETKDSVYFRWSRDIQMWFVFALLPATVFAFIFWYFSRKLKQQYNEARSKVFITFAYIFLVPVFIIIYATIWSFIGVIKKNL